MSSASADDLFVLRAPRHIAKRFRAALNSGNSEFTLQLLDMDGRFEMHLGGQTYKLGVLQLPTVVEVHKTLDKKDYYKCGDVSKMLYVFDPSASSGAATGAGAGAGTTAGGATTAKTSTDVEEFFPMLERDGKLVCDSGLTPPTSHIVRRIYDKTRKQFANLPADHIREAEANLVRMSGKAGATTIETKYEELIPEEEFMDNWGEHYRIEYINGEVVSTEVVKQGLARPKARRLKSQARAPGGIVTSSMLAGAAGAAGGGSGAGIAPYRPPAPNVAVYQPPPPPPGGKITAAPKAAPSYVPPPPSARPSSTTPGAPSIPPPPVMPSTGTPAYQPPAAPAAAARSSTPVAPTSSYVPPPPVTVAPTPAAAAAPASAPTPVVVGPPTPAQLASVAQAKRLKDEIEGLENMIKRLNNPAFIKAKNITANKKRKELEALRTSLGAHAGLIDE